LPFWALGLGSRGLAGVGLEAGVEGVADPPLESP